MADKFRIRPFFWILLFFDVIGLEVSIIILYPTSLFELYKASNPSLGPMIGAFFAFILALVSIEIFELRKTKINDKLNQQKVAKLLYSNICNINAELKNIVDFVDSYNNSPIKSTFVDKDGFILLFLEKRMSTFSLKNNIVFSNIQKELNVLEIDDIKKISEFYNRLDQMYISQDLIQEYERDTISRESIKSIIPQLIESLKNITTNSDELLLILNNYMN